jgi:hypothetical protein
MNHSRTSARVLRLISVLVLAVTIVGGSGAWSAQAAAAGNGPQSDCALLDNPAVRPMMSGMFETTLLRACGRASELGQVKAPLAPGRQAPLLPGTDVQVNNSSGDSGASQTQSETSMAVNETTGTICSGFNDSYSGIVLGTGYTGFSRSTNGGASFTDGGSLGSRSFGDPSVNWRRIDGNFYMTTIDSSGGTNLFRSTDDCATFTFLAMAHSGTSDDKGLLTVDNTTTSPHYGRMYLGWTNFAAGARIYVTTSDNTTTWNVPVALSGSGVSVQGAWPAVAPNGDVYVGWVRWDPYFTGPISIEIAKSTNGGTSWSLVTDPMSSKTNPYLQSAETFCGRPAINGNIRYLPSPQITLSPDGNLHAVYSYDPDTRGVGDVINVYYRRSTDGGTTWNTEVQLNDDGTLRDQWFPTISAGPSGRLVATWYDRRLDAGNLLFTYWMRSSEDGGATWSSSVQVSDVQSPVYLDPGLATCYHGDYDQQKQLGDTVYIQWSDDRNIHSGHQDPDVWFDQNLFAVASTGTLTGVVTDASTTLPISGATVDAGGGHTATTAADGTYTIANLAAGTYNVTASKSGYNSSTVNGVVITANNTTTQNFALTAVTGCTTNCLRVTAITLRSSAAGVAGRVTIKNEAAVAISGAAVTVLWNLPGGSTSTQTRNTNSTGNASFSVTGGTGTYTLTVTNVTKTGSTFDAAGSTLLTKSFTK